MEKEKITKTGNELGARPPGCWFKVIQKDLKTAEKIGFNIDHPANLSQHNNKATDVY